MNLTTLISDYDHKLTEAQNAYIAVTQWVIDQKVTHEQLVESLMAARNISRITAEIIAESIVRSKQT